MNSACRRIKGRVIAGFLVLTAIGMHACGGSGEENEETVWPPNTDPTHFEMTHERVLADAETGGLLQPQIQAGVDRNGRVHIVHYAASPSYPVDQLPEGHDLIANPLRFMIRHIEFDPSQPDVDLSNFEETLTVTPPQDGDDLPLIDDAGIDNCNLLGLSFSDGISPVVVYQGGNRPGAADGLPCNNYYQGDLMVSVRSGNVWQEYMGIQGDAGVKNPYFTDGMVGMAGDVVVDSTGHIHMVAQHYYEWCDMHGASYPDLLYVRQSPAELGAYSVAMESWVGDHNQYGGGVGIQNATGDHCRIILDGSEQPAVFYTFTTIAGESEIRVSRLSQAGWTTSSVYAVPDLYTVTAISPAAAPDGTLGVAYSLASHDDEDPFSYRDHLCYAHLTEDGTWENTAVDYYSYCGRAAVLAFDHHSRPAIAYHDEKAHTEYRERNDLKYAYMDGSNQWQRETAANEGDIGLSSALWFDVYNRANICTYMQDLHKIVVLRRVLPN